VPETMTPGCNASGLYLGLRVHRCNSRGSEISIVTSAFAKSQHGSHHDLSGIQQGRLGSIQGGSARLNLIIDPQPDREVIVQRRGRQPLSWSVWKGAKSGECLEDPEDDYFAVTCLARSNAIFVQSIVLEVVICSSQALFRSHCS
jgi:hypothetical protein